MNPREKGRCEIAHVPPLLMHRNQSIGIGLPGFGDTQITKNLQPLLVAARRPP